MVDSESNDKNIEAAKTKEHGRIRSAVFYPEIIDLTTEDNPMTLPRFVVLSQLQDMIDEEVNEIEHMQKPDLLAPVDEQQAYAFKTAEKFGGVDALVRFRNWLVHRPDIKQEGAEEANPSNADL